MHVARSEPQVQVTAPDFRAIFAREFDYVWATLRRFGVHSSDLEDLTHDVFVAVHRSLADYQPERPLRPWLFGIAFRVASDFRRLARNQRELVQERMPDPPDATPAADELVEHGEARALVVRALEALDDDKRAVFVMHEIDEQTMPEIARTLEIPLNTAYSRLRLARQEFAAAVRRLKLRRGEA